MIKSVFSSDDVKAAATELTEKDYNFTKACFGEVETGHGSALPMLPADMLDRLRRVGVYKLSALKLHPEQGDGEVFMGNAMMDGTTSGSKCGWLSMRWGMWSYNMEGVLMNNGLRPQFVQLSELLAHGVEVMDVPANLSRMG